MFADAQRNRFDESLDRVIAELPEDLRALMEDVPLIVEDEPSRELADQLGIDREFLLGGYISGYLFPGFQACWGPCFFFCC